MSATSVPRGEQGSDALDETDIHDVLSNERRRTVLELLRGECDGEATVRVLSERVAEIESGTAPAPRDLRQSVYVSLQQTHIPKLSELGIVAYDDATKRVRLRERAEDVHLYMEVVPKYGLTWSEYYVGVALLGFLTVAASDVGVPGFVQVPPAAFATAFIAVVLASVGYQSYAQGDSLLHRLRTE